MGVLVRRLLRDRLGQYYAQPAHAVVGSTFGGGSSTTLSGGSGAADPMMSDTAAADSTSTSSLPFSSLWGEWHWKLLYKRLYEQQHGQWLTPVELFRPYYSRAIARWAAASAAMTATRTRTNSTSSPWEIIEVGGGRGTNASIILDYLKAHHPDLYEACVRYTLVDASPTLHEHQRRVLERSSHRHKVEFHLLDLLDVAEGRESLLLLPSSGTTTHDMDCDDESAARTPMHAVILALEVLDNLPHDKVRRIRRRHHTTTGNGEDDDVEWEQAEIDLIDDGVSTSTLREVYKPLSDPLLRQILVETSGARGGGGGGGYASVSAPAMMWIPSVACGTILSLARDLTKLSALSDRHPSRPLSLLAADFDWLPPPDHFDPHRQAFGRPRSDYEVALGEPLVTCMDGYDHRCYLDAPVLSDILFPTDFHRLANFCRHAFASSSYGKDCRVDVSINKQSDFLTHHDDPNESDIDRTRSWLTGYTPLLDDFGNCSVLTMNVNYPRV